MNKLLPYLWLLILVLSAGCNPSKKDLEQAYLEGYRVGWSHGITGHAAQLGDAPNMRWIGIGKECLYDDPFQVKRQLIIFKEGRCEK